MPIARPATGPQQTRRRFLALAAAEGGVLAVTSCSPRAESYPNAVAQTWRAFDDRRTGGAFQRELVRYATLAPSSHNTQCWRFALEEHAITIAPDFARRCPAVDPDDHHLFVSLGCATENLVTGALAHGLASTVRFDPAGGGSVRVAFAPTAPSRTARYAAIPLRQCTRGPYDGTSLSSAELQALAAAGTEPGIEVLFLTGHAQMEQVLALVIAGNTHQIADRAFMAELRSWIRFSDAEAVRTRDGLFSRASGSPTIPQALGNLLLGYVYTAKGENDKYAAFVRSSAGIAVFSSAASDKPHWVEAGRCYQRFVLTATALGIRTAMINQPVEVASIRPQLASALGLGTRRPDLVVRFGRGPEMPRSLRRPVGAVLR